MRFIYFILFFPLLLKSFAQSNEKYLFPIQPGQTASLAGNLGELRSNHFHTGIDIRTNNQINYPVYAAKSGYISRASISSGGFGNVLYVTHPDGNTTLYAHLEKFKGALGEYVLNEQYRRKTFDIDLYFRQNHFAVKQGDTIAFSGNSGSSGGPHLHFDIRDKDNLALDPLSFGFSEVVDVSTPYTEKLALITLDKNSRINNRFGRTEFYLHRNGNNFSLPVPILAVGTIGLEVQAKDKMAVGSPYFGGVKYMEVFVDEKLYFKQTIEKLDLNESRAINTLLSFRSLRGTTSKFYKLYKDDGNTLDFYDKSLTNGKIYVPVNKVVSVRIEYKDAFGNSSSLSLRLQGTNPEQHLAFDTAPKQELKTEILNNTLILQTNQPIDSSKKTVAYTKGNAAVISPAYSGKYSGTFLFDLKQTLPDSIAIGFLKYVSHFKDRIPSGSLYTYYGDGVDITFPKSALYDTLYLQVQRTFNQDGSESLRIGDPLIPLHRFVSVSWKPDKLPAWSESWAVYRKTGNEVAFIGGHLSNDRINFSAREFGSYVLLQDTVPPSIKPIILNGTAVSFRIKDNLSGIDAYEARIKGQWLLMQYDGKSGTLKSERLNKNIPLKGELLLTVTDRSGNKKTFKHLIP